LKLPIRIAEKYTNFVWALTSIVLALDAINIAIEYQQFQDFIYFSIHLLSAILFLIRYKELKRSPYLLGYIVALASTLYVYLYDFSYTSYPSLTGVGELITLLGSILSLIAISSLGKYFGILPIMRGIQTDYIYRFVRHPIYASYILMDIGIVFSYFSTFNMSLFVLAILLFVIRIYYEENLLRNHHVYMEYSNKVKVRLFPYIY
jgi:protein-S-isoprenylcysteine O-methyltransferase Ste14